MEESCDVKTQETDVTYGMYSTVLGLVDSFSPGDWLLDSEF